MKGDHMHIDNRIVEQARSADMIAFFEKRCGVTFTKHYGAYRCKQHPSLAVKNDRRSWYWHSKGVGGCGPLSYLIKIENMPFRKAVETATCLDLIPLPPQSAAEQPKALRLPPKADSPTRLFDYLCIKRGVDSSIVHALIQRKALYEDARGNCVFVGFGEHGEPRFASVRGTYGVRPFRMDCAGSDKRYSFCLENSYSNKLFILESPIDAMSRASIENIFSNDKNAWKSCNYISLAGTSDTALHFFLNKRPTVKELVFCLDSDDAGQKASVVLASKYDSMGFYVRLERPFNKDCNEDLLVILKEGMLC